MDEIEAADLAARLATGAPTVLVDVREAWEVACAPFPGSMHLPLGELAGRVDEIPTVPEALIVTFCHHGVRSLHAAAVLVAARAGCRVRSLAGGIDAWARVVDQTVPRY